MDGIRVVGGNLVLPYLVSFQNNAIVLDTNGEPSRESVDNFKTPFKEVVAAEWSTDAASLSGAAINVLSGTVNRTGGLGLVGPTAVDTIKPIITTESNTVFAASGSSDGGTVVTLPAVSATDNFYVAVPVYCTPASGSVFPVGTITDVCKAVDGSGNYATINIDVTVGATASPCAGNPCAAAGASGSTCNPLAGGTYTCNCPPGAIAAADASRDNGRLTCYGALSVGTTGHCYR
ncbi:hypothetical protein GPECTOR_46g215 [Gonium pectorale]|uniref:HYR domain-containing protein n=1 Tax=Gonium pectorale TaxID=33097 RepID=A0A150G8F8_GONPE|nr:hypothetical protein GPECTOR_46g215 [Gonium pectorale]|eukprot:KXZ46146.1 hypothetical protein GPECTOR_46g215 [Gonium pectorale]